MNPALTASDSDVRLKPALVELDGVAKYFVVSADSLGIGWAGHRGAFAALFAFGLPVLLDEAFDRSTPTREFGRVVKSHGHSPVVVVARFYTSPGNGRD